MSIVVSRVTTTERADGPFWQATFEPPKANRSGVVYCIRVHDSAPQEALRPDDASIHRDAFGVQVNWIPIRGSGKFATLEETELFEAIVLKRRGDPPAPPRGRSCWERIKANWLFEEPSPTEDQNIRALLAFNQQVTNMMLALGLSTPQGPKS